MADVRRLLNEIVPERYEIALDTNMKQFTFGLNEIITFEVVQPSTNLTFHAVDLTIDAFTLDDDIHGSVVYDAEAQTVTFGFEQPIAKGTHKLTLSATGSIQDSLHGFYRSSYKLEGNDEWLVMTQFEAIHAREALVCIDEPAAKAEFIVALTFEDGLTALGNTPVASDTVHDGRRTVRFEPTPRMSTYLLAWVISKLAYREGTAGSDVTIRIYATPQYGEQLDYALAFTQRSLDFYEDYFDLPYPLPKLDLVAVPNFAAGAMENWGLVTYRETDLLVDDVHTSLANKQRVSEVIAHELAHMWFGNLVTMSWWEDLWLNESFASWAETTTVDHLEPSWEWWSVFRAELGAYAREIDALANTHPIQVEVPDPKGLDEIFDAISYFKGQSILRMLEGYLGSEVFRDGLRIYLKRHAYQNTVTDDLWRALSEASGKDVAGLMHAWTSLPGFPYVTYEDGNAVQDRFVASATEAQRLKDSTTAALVWPIPFAATLSSQTELEPMLLTEPTTELPDELVAADWFKPNPGERGFYRSVYTEGMVEALSKPLQDATLPTVDRYGIVSDVWAMAGAGRVPTSVALKLTASLRAEQAYLPSMAVYESLGEALMIVEDEDLRQQFEAFGRWLVEPNYARLGWDAVEKEHHFDTLLRPIVLQQAIRFDVPGARDEVMQRFADYAATGKLDADIRSAILTGAARYGDVKQYEQLLKLYRAEEAPHTRQAQLVSLGRFRQPELAQRTLAFAMSDEVRLQDTVYGLAGVWRTRENRDIAWQHLQDSWDELVSRFGEGGHMLDRFPGFAGGAFATHAKAKEVADFFAAHPHVVVTRPAAQAVEAIEFKADWFDRDGQAMRDFLNQWKP